VRHLVEDGKYPLYVGPWKIPPGEFTGDEVGAFSLDLGDPRPTTGLLREDHRLDDSLRVPCFREAR
jgi:hypothetical protein